MPITKSCNVLGHCIFGLHKSFRQSSSSQTATENREPWKYMRHVLCTYALMQKGYITGKLLEWITDWLSQRT